MESTELTPVARDPAIVREMFGRIAGRYDLANHLLSAGADFYWRAKAVREVVRWQPRRLLDLATGSGDLALKLQTKLPGCEITAADFSPEMLALAKAKGVRHTLLADALQLPFADAVFDCVTVAFGLRNMSDWPAALREMRRVLRPKGHLLVLDFSKPRPALLPAYRLYLHHVLPVAAAWLTQNKSAYDYLGNSIETFPTGEEMTTLIDSCGFAETKAIALAGGVATIYTGEVRD